MAVLHRGQLRFRGSPAALIAAADGMVWQVSASDGRTPDNGFAVVSPLRLAEGSQYRVVGRGAEAYPGAKPVRPSLEDGYV